MASGTMVLDATNDAYMLVCLSLTHCITCFLFFR